LEKDQLSECAEGAVQDESQICESDGGQVRLHDIKDAKRRGMNVIRMRPLENAPKKKGFRTVVLNP